MSDSTPHHSLPLLQASQSQKHITHNEALTLIDGLLQLSVISRSVNTPPTSPSDGDRYLVGDTPSAEWLNQTGNLAFYVAGSWRYSSPQVGWFVWVEDEAVYLSYSGSAWGAAVVEAQSEVPEFGVNTSADTTNRLSVKSDAVLISHDDVTPGSGDIRVNYNKSTSAHTASLTFQSGYSARGEIGLLGDENVSIKTTPDGSNWTSAMVVHSGDGEVQIPKVSIEGGSIDGTEIGISVPSSGQFSSLGVEGDLLVQGLVHAGAYNSFHLTVASNSVGTITPIRQSGLVLVTAVAASGAKSTHTGLFVFQLGTTPQMLSLVTLNGCSSAGASNLTGLTGPADTTSVSAQASEIQVENQTAASQTYSVVFLGGEA